MRRDSGVGTLSLELCFYRRFVFRTWQKNFCVVDVPASRRFFIRVVKSGLELIQVILVITINIFF